MINRGKSVSVIGLGYIGLPTAALLASKGYVVKGVDIDEHAVETINKGRIHIIEPDLDEYVRTSVDKGRLKASTDVQAADIYIICVPTPFYLDSHPPAPNVDYVKDAVKSISPHVKAGDLVILESTSPVGTTQLVREVLEQNGVDISAIFVAYCPERVLPGKIMRELRNNTRVIGGIDVQSTEVAAAFYKTFVNGDIFEVDAKTAEMCKLTENSFRDLNIAFANELSVLCDKNGVDVWELIKLANHHPRVNILQPGTGVGGHCIAVDPWFIVSEDPLNSRIIKIAREVNDSKPDWVVTKIREAAKLMGTRRVACLGLAYKPDIDDCRESPAIRVVESLIAHGCEVSCVDPNVPTYRQYKFIDLKTAIDEFEVIVVLVKHKEFCSDTTVRELKSKGALDFCGAFVN
jgi:UDP-N-acetyl-D-mannosaminuronic acid dehydrogenase